MRAAAFAALVALVSGCSPMVYVKDVRAVPGGLAITKCEAAGGLFGPQQGKCRLETTVQP